MSEALIIGANGQLAFDLAKVFGQSYKVSGSTRQDFDVTDLDGVKKFFANQKFDVVVNTAAFHNTTECEKDPQKSYQVNAIGSLNVAKCCQLIGAKYVYISTDYVFDGTKKSFDENDRPNPLNVYGASKLAGEQLARIGCNRSFIIRTSWLYGEGKSSKGHNFVSLMLQKAQTGEPIKVVNDQFGAPTYTSDLSVAILELLESKRPFGVYHLTNSGVTTWYGFAEEIFRLKGLKVDLSPIKTIDYPDSISRPKCSVLESRKFKLLRDWKIGLKDFLEKS